MCMQCGAQSAPTVATGLVVMLRRRSGEFPRDSPGGGEPTVHAYLGGAVGGDVAAPEVMFAGAVDVGFEAFVGRRHQHSLEARSSCGEYVSQFVSEIRYLLTY